MLIQVIFGKKYALIKKSEKVMMALSDDITAEILRDAKDKGDEEEESLDTTELDMTLPNADESEIL
jgi:hypothetical protein